MMCMSFLVPTLLAKKNNMLLNTDLKWHSHYHSYQITEMERGLGKNINHNTQTPNILTQIILLVCEFIL